MHNKTIFTSLAFLFLFTLFIPHAGAQGEVGLTVQPSTVEQTLDPGSSAEGVLVVTNKSGGRQTYFVRTENIVGMNEGGRPQYSDTPSDDPTAAAAWITPLVTSITLDVGDSAEVPYRIEVPASASPGSHYAAIFVNREADAVNESGAGVGFNVASLFNIRVKGEVVEGMKILSFSSDKTFYSAPEVHFKTKIENTGTVHQRPKGIITITDMLGNEVAQVRFNEQGGGIVPGATREFSETWKDDSFALGRYTALLSVVYGESGKETLTKGVTFWVVPLKEVGIVFSALAGIILITLYLLKAYVRRQLRKAGHTSVTKKATEEVTFARRMMRTLIRMLVVLAILFAIMLFFYA